MRVSIDQEIYERQVDFVNLFYDTAKLDKNQFYFYGANHIEGNIKEDTDSIINQFLAVHRKFFYGWGRRVYVIRGEFTFEEITSDNLKRFADGLVDKFQWFQSVYTIQESQNKRYLTLIVNNFSYDKNHQDRQKLCYKFGTSGIEAAIYSLLILLKNNREES